jgi:oligopeptide transport system substrate-binding protein
MKKTIVDEELREERLDSVLGILGTHGQSILENNSRLLSMLKRRESILRNLTTGGYSISENLDTLQQETHNLFASIQIIAEATEVALSALEEQKKDWEKRYANLDDATTSFGRIIETISKSISRLRELGERIKNIEIAMERIHTISHLTRNVSRNAGIKAYHAGEKGKGFEVISRELSQLTKESLTITEQVPNAIMSFQTQTKEAVNFITELTHNIEQVKRNAEEMKRKLQSSEKLLEDFMAASNIINNSVDKQLEIKEKLGKEEENIADFSTQALVETGNLTNLEQSQSSLSIFINKFVDNISHISQGFQNQGIEKFNKNIKMAILNNDRLKEYILRVSTLTSQINETSREAKRQFESQREKVSQILSVIRDNKSVKQDIFGKTNSLMGILDDVSNLFVETNFLSEKILTIIDEMSHLVKRADDYFSSLEKEIGWVEEILKKLKQFSKRSNLLSLYASIESARAFEFKKGLDVIVNQIKELSQQSSDSLRSIEESVKQAKSSLNNVHQIMIETSQKLKLTKNDFTPLTSGFTELSNSTDKLNDLVNEMLDTLKKQTLLEEKLIKVEETLSTKIDANIKRNGELETEIEKTDAVLSKLLDDLLTLEKKLIPYIPSRETFEKNVLRLRLTGDIMNLDPSKTTDATSHRISVCLYKGLVEQGVDANIIPSIAKRWRVSEDGLIWDFYLRDDVYFHNGDLVTSRDVKTTIEHLLFGPHRYVFDMIKGSSDFIRNKTHHLEGIQILGDFSVRIELNHPHIPFLRNLGIASASIAKISEEEVSGTGPYYLAEWQKGNKIILKAFDKYFGKRSFFDEIHFFVCPDEQETIQRFLKGEFDIIDIPGSVGHEMFLERKEVNLTSLYIYDVYYVGMNVKQETPFKNKLVRQAMNYAIDREKYIENVAKDRGIPAKGIFPPNFSTYNQLLSGYEYNPEKARQLLKQANYPNGLPEKYEFDIRDSRIAITGAKIIQDFLSDIGIHLTLNPMKWEDLLKKAHIGQSLLFSLGWSNDNGDPDSFLYPLFHSKNWGEPGNTTFYKNETVDSLLDNAAALTDHYKRESIYQQVEQFIVDDAPWIFLYHSKHSFAFQSYIKGYYKNPLATERLEDVWKY